MLRLAAGPSMHFSNLIQIELPKKPTGFSLEMVSGVSNLESTSHIWPVELPSGLQWLEIQEWDEQEWGLLPNSSVQSPVGDMFQQGEAMAPLIPMIP